MYIYIYKSIGDYILPGRTLFLHLNAVVQMCSILQRSVDFV